MDIEANDSKLLGYQNPEQARLLTFKLRVGSWEAEARSKIVKHLGNCTYQCVKKEAVLG